MKLDKEKFNELKQLDRTEFRQRWGKVEDSGSSFTIYPLVLFIMAAIFEVGSIILESINHDAALRLFIVTVMFFIFAILLALFELIFVIFSFIKIIKDKKELLDEYFKVEVKK